MNLSVKLFWTSLAFASISHALVTDIELRHLSGLYEIANPSCIDGASQDAFKRKINVYYFPNEKRLKVSHNYIGAVLYPQGADPDSQKGVKNSNREWRTKENTLSFCLKSEGECQELTLEKNGNLSYKGTYTSGNVCHLKRSADQSYSAFIKNIDWDITENGNKVELADFLKEKLKDPQVTPTEKSKISTALQEIDEIRQSLQRPATSSKSSKPSGVK